jgi:hypothetical protein
MTEWELYGEPETITVGVYSVDHTPEAFRNASDTALNRARAKMNERDWDGFNMTCIATWPSIFHCDGEFIVRFYEFSVHEIRECRERTFMRKLWQSYKWLCLGLYVNSSRWIQQLRSATGTGYKQSS